MEIRRTIRSDLEDIARIEQVSVRQPWSLQSFSEALDAAGVIFLTALEQKKGSGRQIAGYCVLYTAADEGEIPAIAVEKDLRRRGIAGQLLQAAAQQAVEHGIGRIFLEVRKSNQAARGLYEKAGFVTDGIRPRFYQDPEEDAVIMHWDLTMTDRQNMEE